MKQLSKRKAYVLSAPHTVSVIIPCRNEEGNVEDVILRCPEMGINTEFIFVEGHSTDETLSEIKRVAQTCAKKNICYCTQDGQGKGDAVRKGFAQATGDILMILDADLTTPPEELPKFFDALVANKGACINGSRLVHGMESGAMGWLAWMANSFFAKLVSLIIKQKVTDTLCGTKVLWRKDYERIADERQKLGLYDPFGDFDLLFGAANLGLKIVDIPVHYERRTYGKTNIRKFKELWVLLWMCWKAYWKLNIKR